MRSAVGELAVVDLMIFRAEYRAGDLSGQMRLLGARTGSRQPIERQAELVLKLQLMRERRLIVGGQRQNQRALAPQFDVDAARAQKFLGKSSASAPGCRGRARPAPLRRARPRSTPRACRRRHGSRPRRSRRGRTPTPRHAAASRQPMPSPTTPAPIMTTRGRLPMDEMVVALNAAPFAGMTQTGSTGLISAAVSAAPHADAVIMGAFTALPQESGPPADGAGTARRPARPR